MFVGPEGNDCDSASQGRRPGYDAYSTVWNALRGHSGMGGAQEGEESELPGMSQQATIQRAKGGCRYIWIKEGRV